MMLNKKGDERVLSLYWMIMFAVVAIVAASAVLLFYSKPFDVRDAETAILADKIATCFSNGGKLTETFNSVMSGEKKIDDACGLALSDTRYESGQYFIKISSGDKSVSIGDESFEAFCGQEESKRNIPLCFKKSFFVLDKDGNSVYVGIEVLVGKVKQNAV